MFAAIKARDVGSLKSLISPPTTLKSKKSQPDPNARDDQGNTPLLIAIGSGKSELVHLLVTCHRVNINLQDIESGYTPLHKVNFKVIYVLIFLVFISWLFIHGCQYVGNSKRY